MQKLILPINKCKITASPKTNAYKNRFGFEHYGTDMVSTSLSRTVWASGDGVVLSVGNDLVFGNCVTVMYQNCLNHRTKEVADLVVRYFHLKSIAVKVGQKCDINTKLGVYGNTGKYSFGAHLHVTADLDCKYFNYEPGLYKNSNIIKRGNSKTVVNAFDYFHRKVTSPECQTLTRDSVSHFNGEKYTTAQDVLVPTVI